MEVLGIRTDLHLEAEARDLTPAWSPTLVLLSLTCPLSPISTAREA